MRKLRDAMLHTRPTRSIRRRSRYVPALLLLVPLSLVACGGGSGASSTGTAAPKTSASVATSSNVSAGATVASSAPNPNGPVTAASLAHGIGCPTADFGARPPNNPGMQASYAPITSKGICSESPTQYAEFFVFKDTTARDHYLSYTKQTSPSVCLLGLEGPNWVAEGMSMPFANTVQAKDGGKFIHVGGGSVCT